MRNKILNVGLGDTIPAVLRLGLEILNCPKPRKQNLFHKLCIISQNSSNLIFVTYTQREMTFIQDLQSNLHTTIFASLLYEKEIWLHPSNSHFITYISLSIEFSYIQCFCLRKRLYNTLCIPTTIFERELNKFAL